MIVVPREVRILVNFDVLCCCPHRRLGPRRAFLVVSSQEWRRRTAAQIAFIHLVRVYLKHALLKRTDNRLTTVAPVNDLLSDTATAQTCAFQGSQILPVI